MLAATTVTTDWTPEALRTLSASERHRVARIDPRHADRPATGRYYWDQCPVLDRENNVVSNRDGELWIALSAAFSPTPDLRHENARLRLLVREASRWRDCGNLLPDGFCPGSREWAGVAQFDGDDQITLYYTAAGIADEPTPTYTQRIFAASATLNVTVPRADRWTSLGEIIRADRSRYQFANETQGQPGRIKAFRDPFCFAAGDSWYLFFSASSAAGKTDKNAVIGLAASNGDADWILQDPVISADGVTNEMERPHMVEHGGSYYLFWSTHGWTFASTINAPTGLYGMVAQSPRGPYVPLNGTGLVAANPVDRPYQAYSWLVLNDLRVASFVDMLDGVVGTTPGSPHYPIGTFEGSLAPEFRLRLSGASAWIDAGARQGHST